MTRMKEKWKNSEKTKTGYIENNTDIEENGWLRDASEPRRFFQLIKYYRNILMYLKFKIFEIISEILVTRKK